ncbi:MAG: hypothetical protein U5K51_12070 [Flavobacteriaceae bacterium]|nr:hypothetical protein [Flavobacteriaceae bacterium]
MIQRVQSLYLILAAIVSGLLVFVFPFYIYNGEMTGIKQAFIADSLYLKIDCLAVYDFSGLSHWSHWFCLRIEIHKSRSTDLI